MAVGRARQSLPATNNRQVRRSAVGVARRKTDRLYGLAIRAATLWRVPADGGTPERLTALQARAPQYSPDGTELLCEAKNDSPNGEWHFVFLSATEGTVLREIPVSAVPISSHARWMPAGQALAFVRNQNGVSNLWAYDLETANDHAAHGFSRRSDPELRLVARWQASCIHPGKPDQRCFSVHSQDRQLIRCHEQSKILYSRISEK